MARKIITNNGSRTVKRKPADTAQTAKENIEQYAAKSMNLKLKHFPNTVPSTPNEAVSDFIQKKAEKYYEKIKKPAQLASTVTKPQDFYQPWKPGNTPSVKDIEKMLQLLEDETGMHFYGPTPKPTFQIDMDAYKKMMLGEEWVNMKEKI